MKHNYGIIFKTSRETAKLSQEEAAELLCKSVRTISDYERNVTLPSIEVMLDMAEVYEDSLLLFKLADPSLVSVGHLAPSRCVVKMLDIVNKVTRESAELISVAADDVIDEQEISVWNRGEHIGDEMIRTGMILKSSVINKNKKALQGGNLERAYV